MSAMHDGYNVISTGYSDREKDAHQASSSSDLLPRSGLRLTSISLDLDSFFFCKIGSMYDMSLEIYSQ